jgi:hypothetical protein
MFFFLNTSEKVARCGTLQMSAICNSAYIPPTAQTRCNIPFLTFIISVAIRALSSCWVFTLWLHIWSFIQTQIKTSRGKVGQRGGHAIAPPLPIHRRGKFTFSHGQCEQNERVPYPVRELQDSCCC